MVSNVRWLYNKLGTTDFSAGGGSVSEALSSLNDGLSGKAESTHSHAAGDLPVSNSLITNSTSYIPSSSAVYSLRSLVDSLSSEISSITSADDDPNTRYESVSLGTWSSVSDVDVFLSKYTHENGYYDFTTDTKLKLGNYVTIQDGTYNKNWMIAGFDCEHNQTAADGTVYDSGYGICLIPRYTYITTGKWNTTATTSGGYISSYMHNTVLPDIITVLKNVFGPHIVNRNVLLSSSICTDQTNYEYYGRSYSYTWTTAEATLPSVKQCIGTLAFKYDDGEANYMLPLFNYGGECYETSDRVHLCTRNISSEKQITTFYYAGRNSIDANVAFAIRPMIYIH